MRLTSRSQFRFLRRKRDWGVVASQDAVLDAPVVVRPYCSRQQEAAALEMVEKNAAGLGRAVRTGGRLGQVPGGTWG